MTIFWLNPKMNIDIEHPLIIKGGLIVPCYVARVCKSVMFLVVICSASVNADTWHGIVKPPLQDATSCHLLLHSLSTFQCQTLLRNVTIEQATAGPHTPHSCCCTPSPHLHMWWGRNQFHQKDEANIWGIFDCLAGCRSDQWTNKWSENCFWWWK